ncbi:hypothetical protein HK103_003820 [Boothiomyces macroporosus]|uniref:Uncharacterized protein n=1 Tax=Boothiomyces macroporosus TaxID=261099 RepID=A0AAD5UM45_9FUNG|nr:hypothetical protein HK103_003820 [Boothiomyces macroporosus]
MFVTIKYGAEEEKLVNPNCLSAVLLNHIRKTCGYENVVENLDLASESGEVMDLASKPKEYAKKFLESRATYILVKVMGDETDESSPSYIPLLDNAADKIKFSVTNPTFRQRAKAKGGKEPTVKEQKEEQAPPKINKMVNGKPEGTTATVTEKKAATTTQKTKGK